MLMGEPIRDFKQLRVYGEAFELAMEIFRISSDWPKRERYALTDQIRRSSRAVCANLAEAWFKRRYPKHFVSKLSDSSAEAAETLVWLDFARASGYLNKDRQHEMETRYRKIIAGLVRMMNRPDQWCVAEELISYDSPA